MRKGAMLRPKTAAIEKRYAGKKDQASLQKKQEEIMELNRQEGYSPFSGCLPMLLQMPIIIALFKIIRNPLTYICSVADETVRSVCEMINKIDPTLYKDYLTLDVRDMDQIKLVSQMRENGLGAGALGIEELPNFTIFGGLIDLSSAPSSDFWSILLIIPILSAALSFAQMKLSRKLNALPTSNDQSPEVRTSNIIMDLTMPLMSLWISYITSAAIGVYWIYRSILGMIQTVALSFAMPMPKFTEADYAEAERAMRPGKKGPSKSVPMARPGTERPRSLHHIDDDDELPYELKPRANGNNSNYHPNKKKSNKNKSKNYHQNNANKPRPNPAPQAAPAQKPQSQNPAQSSGIEAAPLKDDRDR